MHQPNNAKQLITKIFAEAQTIIYALNPPLRTVFLYLDIYTPLISTVICIQPWE